MTLCVGALCDNRKTIVLVADRMFQVTCTAHVATGTLDSLKAKAAFYAENMRRVLAGEPLGQISESVAA